jgi:hypothetical protein
MINTLQLTARKNLIQMSPDVINYNSNCHSVFSRHLTTCLDYFGTIPELMQVHNY